MEVGEEEGQDHELSAVKIYTGITKLNWVVECKEGTNCVFKVHLPKLKLFNNLPTFLIEIKHWQNHRVIEP